uniref:B box-type domain-containing protein n=1 Tax=Magallana gigas TaxID=29159 RepID=A0A8W8IZU1_MAGGI|nr:uncharacterized protein LOC105345229 [Crassostrea gigas]
MSSSKFHTPPTAQHYLVCGTEDCEKKCQFKCNDCHLPMCEQCRDEHQKSPNTKNHEVVPYRHTKRHLPVEKCKDHPTKDIDMICEDCQISVCSKCAIQDHRRHALNDLETIYSENFTLCLDNISRIHQYFILDSQNMQKDIKENIKEMKEIIDNVRRSLTTEAKSLKRLVDTVTSDNIEQVNKMEESLMEELQSQDKTYQFYTSYLEDLVKEYDGYLSSAELHNNPIIFSLSGHNKIRPIPETTKPVPPVFTAGQYSKEDVTKLLGKVNVPDTKPEYRKIKSMENASTQYNKPDGYFLYLMIFFLLYFIFIPDLDIDHLGKQRNPTLSLSSSVFKVMEYTVPGVYNVLHISLGKAGNFWVSDDHGNLVQTDRMGNQLQQKMTSGGYGFYTVTEEGDLIHTDANNRAINRITQDKTITTFFKTGDWEPISIHSSHINGDILVGMVKDEKAKVTRYNKKGEEIQNIQRDKDGKELYDYPHYITENINGDICTSDYNKQAVVVVDKSGQYRFSYKSQATAFRPYGICTDLLGHIIVCDGISVYILSQDGQLLSLLTTQQIVGYASSLSVDDQNNLHVGQYISNLMGQYYTNTVTVYKYLQ